MNHYRTSDGFIESPWSPDVAFVDEFHELIVGNPETEVEDDG